MDASFWEERWERGEIGFHEGKPNPFLVQHRERLKDAPRILVPLSGKAVDLAYLAEGGAEVVGVELVEFAARAFFEEQGLTPEERHEGPFLVLRSGRMTVYVGDVFDATPERLGVFDAVYDRAAVVALPEPLRSRYATTVQALLKPKGVMLAITFVYGDETTIVGPPFSVSDAMLHVLYPSATIHVLETRSFPTAERLRSLGVETMTEAAFWLAF